MSCVQSHDTNERERESNISKKNLKFAMEEEIFVSHLPVKNKKCKTKAEKF
jgi:uncharacterized DUF497 family protein